MRWRWQVTARAAIFAAAALVCASPSFGDDPNQTVPLSLHPTAAPVPALKYQLLPPFLERRSGNAAIHYLKVPHEQTHLFSNNEFWMTLSGWNANWHDSGKPIPLADLRKELEGAGKKYTFIADSKFGIFEHLERGAQCESCDWDLPTREGNFYSVRLPDIQAARLAALILGARARIQMARGQWDEALRTLRVGCALGRHVGNDAAFVVQSLVGITICSVMLDEMETFAQQPGAPNLYWALSSLPEPLVGIHRAIEAERDALYLNIPELRELGQKKYPAEQWQGLLESTIEKIVGLRVSGTGDAERDAIREAARLKLRGAVVAGYPRAKQTLIARGRSAEEVEAMPVAQVVLLFSMQTYEELRDTVFPWILVPAESKNWWVRAEDRFRKKRDECPEILPLADVFLPAAESGKGAETRLRQRIAALRVVEAIRLYGAAHDGTLPDNLSDMTDVPIPNDPMRCEPFVYRREGNAAVLESPGMSHRALHYRIQLTHEGE